MIVTVVRAEGLPGVTPGNVFRRPKHKQTHRRYVRVSMTDKREGRGQAFTAVTSSVAGSGSTCSWGEKGSAGESVSLQVDKDALHSLERRSTESVTDGTAVFELEVWNKASEGGGEDVLLGRGQTNPTLVDSQPLWVTLDPKGKVEISIATELRQSSGGEQIDGDDQNSVSTPDGLASPPGSDHEQNGDPDITEDMPEDNSPDNVPKPSSPKWGLPRMPDLKDTLSVSLGRAAKLRGKQRAQTAGNEANEEHVADGDSPTEEASQPTDEVEGSEGRRQVAIDSVPSDEQVSQGKQASRAALRGMQSIKEGLQARLLGTSGKLSAMRDQVENEEAERATEVREDEGARGSSPASSKEGALSARSTSASSNVAMAHDEPGASEGIVQQDIRTKSMSRDEEGSEPPTEDGGRAERGRIARLERGRSTHLRALLRDASAGDQGEHQGEDDAQDEGDGTDGDQTARKDSVGEQTPESPAKGPVAQVVSALDAISAKATAASASRFKSTVSSSSLASTLKGFGWSRHKEEPAEGGLSSRSESSCEPVQDISSGTPTVANEASEPSSTQQNGSLDPSTPSSEATTLLVTVLRASGLPEILAKSKFGWAKKNTAQDPVVRVSMCGASASSSVVRGGGRECRWGTKNEGEIVELLIPSSNVPAAGLGALKLVLEVLNKASNEVENDILLGRAEIMVGERLGKKAKWVALDAKRSPGGRVKLGLAVKGSEKVGGEHRGSDASDGIAGDSSGDAPDNRVDEAGSTDPNATNALAGDIGGTVQQAEETTNLIEAEANDLGVIAQHDGEASKTAHTERVSNEGVPPLAIVSASGGNQEQAALKAEDASSHVSNPSVEKSAEVQRGGEAAPNESTSSAIDSSSLSSDSTKIEQGKEVGISILVIEADALHTRAPEGDVGTPKSNPYVVLHVCGKKRATSAVVEGGAKCRWPGAGEEISFETSHDALAAVGWGQEDAEGPSLTVEVYNQESQSREEDSFIGSANVMLKEYLGFGPKWVDVHRRRKERGRVLVDVKSPALQQDIPTPTQAGSLDPSGPHADEEQQQEAVAPGGERRKSSSGVLEESGPNENSREETEGAKRTEELLSKIGSDGAEKFESTDAPRSTASDASSTGSFRKAHRNKHEKTLPGADIDATRADAAVSHALELPRQQSQASAALLTPHGDEGETEGTTVRSATAEGANASLVQNDGNEITPAKARGAPDAGAPKEETSHEVARRVAGGTATALDLTAATCRSDQREASIPEEQSVDIGTVVTAAGSKESLEADTPRSSRQESELSSRTVPVALEKNGAGQHHPKERHGSSDLRAGGAPEVSTKDKTPSGYPETPGEAPAEALDKTQPRERARTRKVDSQRIRRAREIIRRRRTMVSNAAGHASPGLRVASGVGFSAAEKAQAATTIQGAFRGRVARRSLRGRQRAVVKIQAAYRGHVERKEFVALSARSKRAKAEEQRARARRSRIALTTQVNIKIPLGTCEVSKANMFVRQRCPRDFFYRGFCA